MVSAGAIVLIIICFAEVGSRFKATGGPYLYARMAFGPVMAFQVGWLMWLARIAGFAAVCNLGIGYLGYFFPASCREPVARDRNRWRRFVRRDRERHRNPRHDGRHEHANTGKTGTTASVRRRRGVLRRFSPLFVRDAARIRVLLTGSARARICLRWVRRGRDPGRRNARSGTTRPLRAADGNSRDRDALRADSGRLHRDAAATRGFFETFVRRKLPLSGHGRSVGHCGGRVGVH